MRSPPPDRMQLLRRGCATNQPHHIGDSTGEPSTHQGMCLLWQSQVPLSWHTLNHVVHTAAGTCGTHSPFFFHPSLERHPSEKTHFICS